MPEAFTSSVQFTPEFQHEINRPLELLIGIRAIALFLKISHRRALRLEFEGAPILRDETGTARTEKTELWLWWKSRYTKSGNRKKAVE